VSAVTDEEHESAAANLRRLVSFLASALDVRYAFVSTPRPSAPQARMSLWLARDYGLRSEAAQGDDVEVVPTSGVPSPLDILSVLRGVWPDEVDLAGLDHRHVVSLLLLARGGGVMGHMGIVDPVGRRVRLGAELLRPLARRAAAELEQWASTRR
jgi:hypothetical protein